MINELLLASLLIQTTQATTKNTLGFLHDGVDIDRYELSIDSQPFTTIQTTPVPNNPTLSHSFPFPALTPGEHTATVRACNIVCSENSNILTFRLRIHPNTPTNFQIIK